MVILIQCTDRVGLVAGISKSLADLNLNITAMREYVDASENRFYMRLTTSENTGDVQFLRQNLSNLLPGDAEISINPNPDKKIIVFVTKEYHCLSDILIRHHFKTLGASVQCVIGNHETLREICDRFEVPFYFVPNTEKTKEQFEQEVLAYTNKYQVDFIVLAKFMQILSPDFVSRFAYKIVNIHHSFLPAFAGASPYKKAFERGVKLIGATAHFVTNDLDEGPIIVQQTINVNHRNTVADMIKSGREIETSVLAKALQLVFEDRVFVHGNKTVVFK